MNIVFISSAYRGKTIAQTVKNIRKAEQAAMYVWSTGNVAVCPHTNSALFDGIADDDVFLSGYLRLLEVCNCVYAVDWSRSAGAKAEIAHAEELGIPVFYNKRGLRTFLDNERIL